LGAVVLLVDDLASVLRFYRDVLGFRVSRLDPGPGYRRCEDWAYLEAGEMGLEIRARSVHGDGVPRGRPGRVIPAFEVDDLDATIERLRESGVAAGPPRREPWGSWTRIADPEGNLLEIFSPDPEWWDRRSGG
jgi:catechol 2,3-dioxygenase-like lactoylglutathione lyase family enzyme